VDTQLKLAKSKMAQTFRNLLSKDEIIQDLEERGVCTDTMRTQLKTLDVETVPGALQGVNQAYRSIIQQLEAKNATESE
jgi:hypothetical protein